jgi:protein-L-isoaspartate(D-aspartate) O-methyltransferase
MIAIHVDLVSDELGQAALDERVFTAMRREPRHLCVPVQFAPGAYTTRRC